MAEDKIKGFNINKNGYGTVPKSVMQDKELCIAAKAVYAYFCSFTGSGDTCFPTRKKICYDLDISNDSLSKYLNQLINNGYLEVEQIKENGRFSHNVYTLPDTILPCPKISDTEETEPDKTDTKKNKSKNNNVIKRNNKKKRESKPFVPPTLEEVQAYCRERNNNVDAKKFFDYFVASDWIDSKGNPVRNWKQKVITWESYASNDTQGRNGNNGQNAGDSSKTQYSHIV